MARKQTHEPPAGCKHQAPTGLKNGQCSEPFWQDGKEYRWWKNRGRLFLVIKSADQGAQALDFSRK